MLSPDQVDRLLCTLACWDVDTLQSQLLAYPSRFPIDLTPAYMATQSADRLRHLFFAVCVQNRRLPDPLDRPALAA